MLASLLYLGSGTGLLLYKAIIGPRLKKRYYGTSITKNEAPWLTGAILFGGVAAPIALMYGLNNTPAATASLLLNFESVATAIIAVVFFKDILGRKAWMAIGAITIAGIILTADPESRWGISAGAIGVLLACIFWGLDNNLTRHICCKDPLDIGMIKGISAGIFSFMLAVLLDNDMPSLLPALGALLLGSISYGMSVVLIIYAMRGLGASRASAWFATAPFAGVIISFLIFREMPGVSFLLALMIMIIGAALLLSEEHRHVHKHPEIEHEHEHLPGDLSHEHKH
jgi:drug/metabolite transporter (DMT)-like permease